MHARFPDSPFTYRYLLPELARAGFHAVAPFVRGFAPTELPPLRYHVHTSVMVADQIALARALGGSSDALLVAHDWGAVGAWGATKEQVERVKGYAGPGSDSELIEGVGHFMLVERPEEINKRITDWLARTS